MTTSFTTDELRAGTGERLAILLRGENRQPLYWPNLFATTQLRVRSLATNTIRRALQNIGFLYQWAETRNLDLDHLLVHGDFLSLSQVEQLANDLRYSRRYLVTERARQGRARLRSLEQIRKSKTPVRVAVGAGEAAVRITDAARYLEWHATRRIGLIAGAAEASHFRALYGAVISQLRELTPQSKLRDADTGRTGLLVVERTVLLEAIEPDSKSNPFRGEFQRLRNYLYISLLYYVGYRRGESLQLKVEDINVHGRIVKIHRSADDVDDLRLVQPRTKTLARSVPIPAHLAEELYDYVDQVWSKIPLPQRRHGYLWTTVDGTPLALSTVNDMFRRLRCKVRGLPPDLTPHTLRHDWNERFSEAIDVLSPDRRPGELKEAEIRRRMMGWSSDSTMAERYTRRYVREKAAEILEEMVRPPDKPRPPR